MRGCAPIAVEAAHQLGGTVDETLRFDIKPFADVVGTKRAIRLITPKSVDGQNGIYAGFDIFNSASPTKLTIPSPLYPDQSLIFL